MCILTIFECYCFPQTGDEELHHKRVYYYFLKDQGKAFPNFQISMLQNTLAVLPTTSCPREHLWSISLAHASATLSHSHQSQLFKIHMRNLYKCVNTYMYKLVHLTNAFIYIFYFHFWLAVSVCFVFISMLINITL